MSEREPRGVGRDLVFTIGEPPPVPWPDVPEAALERYVIAGDPDALAESRRRWLPSDADAV